MHSKIAGLIIMCVCICFVNNLKAKEKNSIQKKIDNGMNYQQQGKYNKALSCYKSALKESYSKNDTSAMIGLYNNLGIIYYFKGEYPESINWFKKYYKINKGINDSENIANAYNNIGNVNYIMGNYSLTIDYYYKSLKIKEKIGDSSSIAKSLFNIANVYKDINENDKALINYRKAEEVYKNTGNKGFQAACYNNIGIVYENLEQYDNAIENYNKAISIRIELKDSIKLATNYINTGSVLQKIEKYNEAIDYFRKAESICIKSNNKHALSTIYNDLGSVYFKQAKYRLALNYFFKSLSIAQEIKSMDQIKRNYNNISEAFKQTGKFEKAIKYKELYIDIKDSLFNIQKHNEISKIRTAFETEKKEKQIEILHKEKEAGEAELKRKNLAIWFAVSGLTFISLLVLLLYSRNRIKKKTNLKLSRINDELEKSEKQLKQLNSTKDRFFSILAHDLKSPLLAFKSITNMMNKSYKDLSQDEIKELSCEMNSSSSNILSLFNNLLDWSKTQIDAISVNNNDFYLQEVIADIEKLYKAEMENKQIILIKTFDKNLTIYSDKNIIFTILRNLISNAIKFSDTKSEIIVTGNKSDSFINISIIDNACGMSGEDIKKLFKIDVSAKNIGDGSKTGTGLGLIICKELIDLINGEISVISELHKGSKFCIKIPLNKKN